MSTQLPKFPRVTQENKVYSHLEEKQNLVVENPQDSTQFNLSRTCTFITVSFELLTTLERRQLSPPPSTYFIKAFTEHLLVAMSACQS